MTKERCREIAERYAKKSEKSYMTYQETGRYIYDWYAREYDDIATLATESLNAVEVAQSYASLRVWFSEFLDRLERGEDVDRIVREMGSVARAFNMRR